MTAGMRWTENSGGWQQGGERFVFFEGVVVRGRGGSGDSKGLGFGKRAEPGSITKCPEAERRRHFV